MQTQATPFEALRAAVTRAGSQSAMARLCGVSQTAVWKWIQSGKRLPAEHCLVVERKTGISKHVLRPDIYPADQSSVSQLADAISECVSPEASTVDFDRAAISKRAPI